MKYPDPGRRGRRSQSSSSIPLTYTTAPGDTERQISLRFSVTDLEWANRPLTGTDRIWYAFTDLPAGEVAPGQTISLALNKAHPQVGLTWPTPYRDLNNVCAVP